MANNVSSDIDIAEFYAARERIYPLALATPLIYSRSLSDLFSAQIYLKCEQFQPTGAFKIRGAANTILGELQKNEQRIRRNGVVTASTGNHGRAVSYVAKKLGIPATVYLSSLVPENKVRNIELEGSRVVRVGASQDDAMAEVKRAVAEFGMIEIPPFDHPSIIAGQGTIAFELNEQLNDIDYIFSGLSGGGLLGGIGLAMKHLAPQTHIVGVSLAQGAAMWESLKAGKPVMVEEVASVADSLGGGIGMDNRWTLPAVKQVMDKHFQVSDDYIAAALLLLFEKEKILVEGAAAVGLAALLQNRPDIKGRKVVLILSGNSIATATLPALRQRAVNVDEVGQ
ncbi:pyridoxal-phosphate dependent enzyme [Klebsiella pneumoniae]|uniref:pyridoxal-phosphate dependent enzyme n=1 Tax=Klebsiella pneumoniae TaxID=573 RepID=UPI0020CD6B88|nr:pyridoxal-phosphate dependent enzyme [Klebsiella pneumoniae]MCQ0729910.1 pyridoxal-phosphate dependent enzyme [Klebsiella pneumoniae]